MSQRRRSSGGGRRRAYSFFGLLVTLALVAPWTALAESDKSSGAFPITQSLTLQPIKDSLSSAAWAATQGLDPRFATTSTDHGNATAWDTSAAGGNGGSGGGANQQVPFRNPAPAFSRNLIVTRQLGLFPVQTEPSIAVDPTDPEHIVMGTIDYNFPGMSTYTSFDGGVTWSGPNQVRYFREDLTAAGDPVVAFDRDGTVYMSSISLGQQEFRLGSLVSSTEVSSMVVSKSTDGGLTWTDAVSAARSTITTQSNVDAKGKERGTFTSEFLDKEWISVGPNINDPSKDSIYLTYTDFATTYSLIYADEVGFLSSPFTQTAIKVVHSEDGGVTWSAPVAISPTVLQAQGASEPGGAGDTAPAAGAQQFQDKGTTSSDANRTVQGSQPKVMKDGSVVATYLDTTNDGIQQGFNTVMFVKSVDGGRTWTDPKQIGLFREPHGETRSAFFRYWGTAFPQLAVGPKNDIYVATTALPEDKPVDDGDIYLMRSLDGGDTWQPSQRINTDKTNRPQFYPSIDVDPNDVVHLMWGDMRDDPQEVRYNIYYSRSEDQGKTWGFSIPGQNFTAPDTRVSDFASNSLRGFPRGAFIGDYFSLAATDGDVYMVWADTRLGEFGGANQQIAFARQKAIKPPTLFLNPPSGAAGRTVDIQGFGFQPLSSVQLLVSGVIVANQRTNEKGGFQSSIYMPLTGEGPTSITAYDETGNVATSSFYTEFGFDTLQKSLDQINGQLGLPNQGSKAGASPAATPVTQPVVTPTASTGAQPTATPATSRVVTPAATPTAAG